MNRYILFGTYTQTSPDGPHRSQGVYIYQMDPNSGELNYVSSVDGVQNPSFLDVHPTHRFLYTVNEFDQGRVSAVAIGPNLRSFTFLNSQSTGGSAPCYLSLDPAGKWLFVANYGSGSLAVFPILPDGSLGPASDFVQHQGSSANKIRQTSPFAHSILFDPTGRFVLAADLGIDRVLVYRLDESAGRLHPHDPSGMSTHPGAGPRHLVFHPNQRFLYVSNELDSTVTACSWDSGKGSLKPIQALSTLPPGFSGENGVADIRITPSGSYLYVSNRGHNSLAIYAVNSQDGTLTPNGIVSTLGNWPRNFAIDPSGAFLYAANQFSDTVVTFRVDGNTGQLIPTGQVTSVPSPVCVKIVDL